MYISNIPAKGGPIIAATPWNIKSSPKAFVNFSNPSRSTTIIVLRDEKQAETKYKFFDQ